ncbi:MAG: prolyl oligopeptidase family serine peptidase [Flavobacteriaceae bacterium]|nr:prolyl oligopeptidase family serine peptidase [Flavobacteriaceae bacterium]
MTRKLIFHSVFFTLFLALLIWGCAIPREPQYHYPPIEGKVRMEKRFGISVTDPYSNLEDNGDTLVQQWFHAQDSLTEGYFRDNAHTRKYLEHFRELESGDDPEVQLLQRSEDGSYFYLLYDVVAGSSKVYHRKSMEKDPVLLFDARKFGEGDTEVNYLKPSYDGQQLAIGLHKGSDFGSTVVVVNVASKTLMPDRIEHINPDFGGIEWLPDSSGVLYLYFPVVELGAEGYKKGSYSVLHRWGQEPMPIFGGGVGPDMPNDHYPKVKVRSSLDRYVIGYKASSNNYYDAYITDIESLVSGRPDWKLFFTEAEKVFYNDGEVRGEYFIYLQATPNGNRLCLVSLQNPDLMDPDILAMGTADDPITKFEVTRDHIYFIREKFGVEVSLFQLEGSTDLHKLDPPFAPGWASFYGESVAHNDIGARMDGWTAPTTRYELDSKGGFILLPFEEELPIPSFENLVSEQVMVPSHDGEQVPLSLVYPKDLERDGTHPVFMYVYGAYGDSMSPFFFPMFLDWAGHGGILAFPHVRGGGEKGPIWHEKGMKDLKYNSWKDLISCTEYLIENGWTRQGKIALYTVSAGGITAGMAVNERPELFSSLIAEVPRMHPYGLEASSSASSTSYLEYGSITDSLECQGLLAMDPYLNLSGEKSYPATLLFTSYTDDRIPIWDNGKYLARLQANTHTKGPILMDIDFDTGHADQAGLDESVILHAKIFGFAKAHLK